jgi:diguanylate cyclase (GGDEF)-like protein
VAKDQPLDQIAAMIANAVARHLPESSCSIQIELPGVARISVSPGLPAGIADALGVLPVSAMQLTLLPQPLELFSAEQAWRVCTEACPYPSLQRYRAVPILRNSHVVGLLISFLAPGKGRASRDIEDEKVLESWGQFASLAVERRGLYEQLSFRAQYDSLTSLLNRASFYESLDAQIRKACREGTSLAVVYLDLDNFKEINDRYGHGAGDTVLQETARQIVGCVRHSDVVGRIGGDEFVVIMPGVSDRAEAMRVGDSIVNSMHRAASNGSSVQSGASFGVGMFPQDGDETNTLLQRADEDMYRAKSKSRALHQRSGNLTSV